MTGLWVIHLVYLAINFTIVEEPKQLVKCTPGKYQTPTHRNDVWAVILTSLMWNAGISNWDYNCLEWCIDIQNVNRLIIGRVIIVANIWHFFNFLFQEIIDWLLINEIHYFRSDAASSLCLSLRCDLRKMFLKQQKLSKKHKSEY